MAPRIRALVDDPVLFAHRGASAVAPENTIEAFETALRLGANGLESDVWLTSDGVPVLVHDERFGRVGRRRRIAEVAADDLPDHIPQLGDLFAAVGTDYQLSLDIKDPASVGATIDVLRRADVVRDTWLCHPDIELLTAWRRRWSDVRLVHSTKIAAVAEGTGGAERHAAALYERTIDAVNLRQNDWQGGLTALYHRFDLRCFGWDAQLERVAAELLDMGVDAIYGNHVDRLLAARDRVYGP